MRASMILIAGVTALALASCGKKEDDKAADAAVAGAVAEAPPGTPQNPQRRPGLWEQTVAAEGAPAQVMKICLDEATDAKMSAFGNRMADDACSENKSSRAADGSWVFESVCNLGTGGTVASKGVAKGDFNSSYSVEATSTTTGAQVPQMNRTATAKIDAKWVGPCPADMTPGDMDLGNGMILNMSGMKAMQEPPK